MFFQCCFVSAVFSRRQKQDQHQSYVGWIPETPSCTLLLGQGRQRTHWQCGRDSTTLWSQMSLASLSWRCTAPQTSHSAVFLPEMVWRCCRSHWKQYSRGCRQNLWSAPLSYKWEISDIQHQACLNIQLHSEATETGKWLPEVAHQAWSILRVKSGMNLHIHNNYMILDQDCVWQSSVSWI